MRICFFCPLILFFSIYCSVASDDYSEPVFYGSTVGPEDQNSLNVEDHDRTDSIGPESYKASSSSSSLIDRSEQFFNQGDLGNNFSGLLDMPANIIKQSFEFLDRTSFDADRTYGLPKQSYEIFESELREQLSINSKIIFLHPEYFPDFKKFEEEDALRERFEILRNEKVDGSEVSRLASYQYFFVSQGKDINNSIESIINFKNFFHLYGKNQIKCILFFPRLIESSNFLSTFKLNKASTKIENAFSTSKEDKEFIDKSNFLVFSTYSLYSSPPEHPPYINVSVPKVINFREIDIDRLVKRYETVLYKWRCRLDGIQNDAFKDEEGSLDVIGKYEFSIVRNGILRFFGGY